MRPASASFTPGAALAIAALVVAGCGPTVRPALVAGESHMSAIKGLSDARVCSSALEHVTLIPATCKALEPVFHEGGVALGSGCTPPEEAPPGMVPVLVVSRGSPSKIAGIHRTPGGIEVVSMAESSCGGMVREGSTQAWLFVPFGTPVAMVFCDLDEKCSGPPRP